MFGIDSLFVDVLLFVVAIYTLWLFSRRKNRNGEPPIVTYWIPWLGSGIQYNKDQVGFLKKCEKKYGPIFTVYMAGKYFTFVTDPLTHPSISKESKKLSFRANSTPVVKRAFDFDRPGIEQPTMGGLIPKYFQGVGLDQRVEETMENFFSVLQDPVFTAKEWEVVDLYEFCLEVMYRAGTKTLLGPVIDGYSRKDLLELIDDYMAFDAAFLNLVQGQPMSMLKKANKAREKFWKIIKHANKSKAVGMFEEHIEYSKKQNRSHNVEKEHFAIWWAAESNTIMAAFWTLYFVLKHPEAFEAAKEDVEETLKKLSQDPKSNFKLSRSDLDQMRIIDSIVNESLRLGVSPAMLRRATDDVQLDVVSTGKTYRIRKGDNLMALFQLTHYDPELYKDPHSFKYDRFLKIDQEKAKEVFCKNGKPVRFYFMPFGSGLSKCPGRQWAVTEIKQFLSHMLVRYDMELVNPNEVVEISHDRFAIGGLMPRNRPKIRFKLKDT